MAWKRFVAAGLFLIAAVYLCTTFLAWSMVQAAVQTMLHLLRLL